MSIFNSNLKKRQSQLAGGFMMLEVACALVLVLLVSVVLVQWQSILADAGQNLTRRAQALILACSVIEQYRATGEQISTAAGFTIIGEYIPDQATPEFYWVQVTITWQEKHITQTISLRTGVLPVSTGDLR